MTAPARNYLNTSFTETPTSRAREGRPTVKIHPEACARLGIGAGGPHEYPRIARTPPAEIHDHVVAADCDGAEALVISCTDFPVLDMIAPLEDELAKPVVTSNQATFWAALRAAGIDDRFDRYGALLSNY